MDPIRHFIAHHVALSILVALGVIGEVAVAAARSFGW